MPDASPTAKIVRFGVFEADLVTGELRREGLRVRLQEQPFQVLAMLLERPGELVTREEMQKRLWPADTFVDFDHSLNTAVNKLREALSDAAANPRFVQTVARRGYRFIAPLQRPEDAPGVSTEAPAQSVLPSMTAAANAEPANTLEERAPLHPELEIPVPRRGLTRGLFALIQGMYLIFYVVALARLGEVHRIADLFLPGRWTLVIVAGVLVTAGVGIPLRCYLLSAVGFDHQRLGEKFERLFPGILALDQLWAAAPFLLMEWIGFGAAFAACAALLYLPFAERSLLRMAYGRKVSNRIGDAD
jgi:DNA-binding winged helix-turn-helix (wHTH) protein